MSLEFPLEARKIGRFCLVACDRDNVEYHCDEQLDSTALGDAIKDGFRKHGTLISYGFEQENIMWNYYFNSPDLKLEVSLNTIEHTGVVVKAYPKEGTGWRALFKKQLGYFEEILETI